MDFPAEPVVRSVIQGYARILDSLADELGEAPLVLPNGEFFPDKFVGDEASVQRLLDRVLLHAGMEDVAVKAELIGEEGKSCGTGGCGTGACGTPKVETANFERLARTETGYVVRVHEKEMSHPVVLTAALARSAASIFLAEAEIEESALGLPLPIAVEFTSVALGFGSLLLQGSYIYQKGCGGPSVARITELSCGELAVAYALFVAMGKHSFRRASKELGATQQEFVAEAKALVDSNPELLTLLQKRPARVASGEFALGEAKSWLMRLFGGKKQRSTTLDPDASLEELEAALAAAPREPKPRTRAADPKFDEIRKLVDEALSE
jgi:hypothetical protein